MFHVSKEFVLPFTTMTSARGKGIGRLASWLSFPYVRESQQKLEELRSKYSYSWFFLQFLPFPPFSPFLPFRHSAVSPSPIKYMYFPPCSCQQHPIRNHGSSRGISVSNNPSNNNNGRHCNRVWFVPEEDC